MNRILLVDGTNIVMRYAHAMASQSVVEPDSPAFSADTARVASACLKAIRECAKVALSERSTGWAARGPSRWM